MVKAVRIHEAGGPEVMKYEDVDIGDPATGEIKIKNSFIGLNYIDTYHRSGLYPVPLPATLGLEGAGVITAVGDGVTEFEVGDRVCYGAGPLGAYAEERLIPWDRVVKLPDSISEETAAAMMLQGMTVEYLIRRTYRVKEGDTVLFHAAAGGVGLLACQWLKQLGATVIGTVGSEAKAELAKAHGADHIIYYNEENVATKVKEITDGKGVPVVYDGVGASTFESSLDSLSPRGMMVSYGNASGPVPPFDVGILAAKGSLFFTRPSLMTYVASRADLVTSTNALFEAIQKGLEVNVMQNYALSDIQQAHIDLESRKTT
ncbi:quinone oxidoreductase family protein, partial [Curvivirga aplysinae]|uniref:quinone oxidoreductase family protein n=1 Tax=Curvivirga aplysinae TaxID=2529852 RepID=UPI0012BD25DE